MRSFSPGGQEAEVKSGFTVMEIMVAMVLFMLVMLLLVRGMNAVTTTVTLGQRRSEVHRHLKNVRRVMREDVESMIVHPDWPVFVGDSNAAAPQMMLAFLRYRAGTDGEGETEWVQYWREEHAEEALQSRLQKWVRYSAPGVNRETLKGEWWLHVNRSQLSGEILADDLIALDLQVQSAAGTETGRVTRQVEVVDVRIFLTVPPVPPAEAPLASTPLKRMEEEEGSWMQFRSRPGFVMGPDLEEDIP
ncbi:hypothetical protein P0Y35_12845 [Kiritimatiellaeota bacterium B1221]|nr:hypothetical protein [Kiritimatiellaeota bacterium B1221]